MHYDDDTRRALGALSGDIDSVGATAVWESSIASVWDKPPVWFHGNITRENLLVVDGQLSAVIDFGTSGIGDPACDLVIAWQMFSGKSREAFQHTVSMDSDTWARARGWALWKAATVLSKIIFLDKPLVAAWCHQVISDVLADFASKDRFR
jgi:aminoglycoside phosphotransferase (APT) family kinase protein